MSNLSKFFQKNGYLHIKSFVSKKITNDMKSHAETLSKKEYRNFLNFHLHKSFKKFFVSKTFLNIVDSVMQHRMIPVGSVFYFCKPKNKLEKGSVWHTDTSTVKSNFGSYLTVAIILDDANSQNGCLQLIPGSHKIKKKFIEKPNYVFNKKGKMISSNKVGNTAIFNKKYLKKKININCKEGDLIFIHDNLLHKADKNKHPIKWRRFMYYHFIKDGEPFWPGWTARRKLIDRPY